MKQYKIGEVEMRFAKVVWRMEPVSKEELAEAVRAEFGWKRAEIERMLEQLFDKGIFVFEEGLIQARVSQTAFCEERAEDCLENQTGRGLRWAGKNFSGGFLKSFWAPVAFEEGDVKDRIKNIVRYRKAAVILSVCAVLVCILAACLFFTKAGKKEFSFQSLKREDILKVEFNTREDFYYIFDEKETDVICRMLQKIMYEDSGTEDMKLADGEKIRLTLTDGAEIVFVCSGHTIQIQGKCYYVEGDVLDRITYKCMEKWMELCSESERRMDFYDLYEATVRDVKVYEGFSLCYTLNEKERKETLRLLRDLGSFENHHVRQEDEANEWYGSLEKRFLVEKEDGVQIEFYVNPQRVYVNEQMVSIPEEKGRALKERQDAWLLALRENTRQKPFAEVTAEKAASVSVVDYRWGNIQEISDEAREELLATLQELEIVGTGTKDHEELVGGMPTEAFQIEDTEGNVITISADDDPFVVNGKGYCIENKDKAEKLMELYERWGMGNTEPVENQEVYENEFRLTIRSSAPEYPTDRFIKTTLFTLELEYIGAEEEIQVWHGDSLASIDMETEDGRSVFGFDEADILRRSILRKGEPYRLELDGKEIGKWIKWIEEEASFLSLTGEELSDGFATDLFENGSLKPGEYRAIADVEFLTDFNQLTEKRWNLKLPVQFEIVEPGVMITTDY